MRLLAIGWARVHVSVRQAEPTSARGAGAAHAFGQKVCVETNVGVLTYHASWSSVLGTQPLGHTAVEGKIPNTEADTCRQASVGEYLVNIV